MFMKIVLVNGCFNFLHADHVKLLKFASSFGQVVVAINSDEYMYRKYGSGFTKAIDRIMILESCKYVSKVVVFSEENPRELIRKLKPDFIVKGPDYLNKDIPEAEVAKEMRIPIIYRPGDYSFSSSELLTSFNLKK